MTYGIEGILDTFVSEGYLIDIELLILKVSKLTIIHFSSLKDMHGFLLKLLLLHAFCIEHFFLDLH